MIEMCQDWRERGLSYREMSARWAERFPRKYPMGEYDPGVRKPEARFRKLPEK